MIGCIKFLLTDHTGTGHRIAHNITTLVNIPLVAWVIYAIFSLQNADYEAFIAWLSQPWNIAAAILLTVNTLIHFTLELEVVFEDYISNTKLRATIITLMKAKCTLLAIVTIISLIKVGL